MTTDVTTAAQTDLLETFLGRVDSREAVIGVVGLGYVGLPLVLIFEEAGFPVIGFDVDAEKANALSAGNSYIRHIGPERVRKAFVGGKARAVSDFSAMGACDAILVCVPTPLGAHREPDLKYIRITAETIA